MKKNCFASEINRTPHAFAQFYAIFLVFNKINQERNEVYGQLIGMIITLCWLHKDVAKIHFLV